RPISRTARVAGAAYRAGPAPLAVRAPAPEIAAMPHVRVALVLALALLGGAAASPAQQGDDTALTVEGFLQNDEQFDLWTIVTPLPLQALGVRTFVLPLVGRGGRWSRYRNE